MRPLHFAAQSASQEVCKLLVQKGAEPSVADDDGRSPIDLVPSDELLGSHALDWQELLGSAFAQPPIDSKVTGLGSVAAVTSALNPQGPSYLPPAPFSMDRLRNSDNEGDLVWLGGDPLRKADHVYILLKWSKCSNLLVQFPGLRLAFSSGPAILRKSGGSPVDAAAAFYGLNFEDQFM
eukprot:Skav234391  [mRNA]  locus=scaffold873:47764:51824:+ [translate_table: standard]